MLWPGTCPARPPLRYATALIPLQQAPLLPEVVVAHQVHAFHSLGNALCPQVVQCKAHCLRQSMPITRLLICVCLSLYHFNFLYSQSTRSQWPGNCINWASRSLCWLVLHWNSTETEAWCSWCHQRAIQGTQGLRDMLLEWLNNSPNSSWEGLILALKSPIVGRAILADHLQTICRTQELPTGRHVILY